jgi:hypothetical protein
MSPIFGLAAGRRAVGRRAMLKPMLLLLEGEEIIDPFRTNKRFKNERVWVQA